jgi:threonyl-tRNA synthetase
MSEAVDQGRRTIESSGPLMDVDDGANKHIGGDSFLERTANPSWLKDRTAVYDTIKARRDTELATKVLVNISVTMPDGTVFTHHKVKKPKVVEEVKEGEEAPAAPAVEEPAPEPFQAWKTTPYDVACTISQGLADSSTVARVTYTNYVDDYSPAEDGMEAADTLADALDDMDLDDNDEDGDNTTGGNLKSILWDMNRPLVGPVAKLELLKFDNDHEAKTVFWHSSAHMMGEALEHLYGVKLTIGPPLKGGFYYDSYMGKDSYKDEDYKDIQKEVTKIIKQKQKFERLVVTKNEALELFADNPFKVKILKTKVADNTRTTVYKCGDLIDLCRGPHLTNTGKVKAFAASKHSAAYWLGDAENDSLQRLYGISFPDKKQLKIWQEMMEKVRLHCLLTNISSSSSSSSSSSNTTPFDIIFFIRYCSLNHSASPSSFSHFLQFNTITGQGT